MNSRQQQIIGDFSRIRKSRCIHDDPWKPTLSTRSHHHHYNTHIGLVLDTRGCVTALFNRFQKHSATLTRNPLRPEISSCSWPPAASPANCHVTILARHIHPTLSRTSRSVSEEKLDGRMHELYLQPLTGLKIVAQHYHQVAEWKRTKQPNAALVRVRAYEGFLLTVYTMSESWYQLCQSTATLSQSRRRRANRPYRLS